ncbi:MAG TPA: hypothetical protein VGN23_05880 [Verrucomicrobiae bacterium]|jgi:hypothetical protein
MNDRLKKILLVVLAVALLFASGGIQSSLNRDRKTLALTVAEPLQNAPPLLAFTTVALGGFRGLISNYLWIRANSLQEDDKFFEAAQLANWITDLEPRFSQVWIFQAWNMAFNISVKFKDFGDRWRWVQNGISLLRDKALVYNPDNVQIHQQLAWFYQMKLGDYLDDANNYYKQHWAQDMTPFFGPQGTNFTELLQPHSTNAVILRERYKIDPAFAAKVNEEWGPLDWRLPEAHAIYWACQGLEDARKHPEKVKEGDLIQLRRVIYQSLLQAFRHGRIISDPFTQNVELEPNLDLMDKANDAYMQMYAEETDPNQKNGILIAHRNFLRTAIEYLYMDDRTAAAQKWFKYLGDHYPDKPILDYDAKALPKTMTLDEYIFRDLTEDASGTSLDDTTSAIEGFLRKSYLNLALGQDDRYTSFQLIAQKLYNRYQEKMGISQPRVALPPMKDMQRQVLDDLLNPQSGLAVPYAYRAVIRTYLKMGPETNSTAPFQVSTNEVAPALTVTNAATNAVSQ